MKKFATEIKHGDIFVAKGMERVAIEDYPANGTHLWVTNRKYYNRNGLNYGPTSALLVHIKPQEAVECIGNMEEELSMRNIDH